MQIQALDCRCRKPHFSGVKSRKESFETPKEMSNEEVLTLAKARRAPKTPTFTPKQKEIFPVIEEFKSSGVLDIMQEYLSEADEITEMLRKTGKKSACFEDEGTHYCYKKTQIPEENGYNITISAKDFDGEELYNYTSKVRGGYSKHSVKIESENFGKVELVRQGRYGSSMFFVNNAQEEGYRFAGDITKDGESVVDSIMNFR